MNPRPAVRFCPFCRESFEVETHCPEHELELVAFESLQVPTEPPPAPDDWLPLHESRFGRALLFVGVVLLWAGFFAPFVVATRGSQLVQESAFSLSEVAPNLWSIPMVGMVFLAILARLRTLRALARARFATLLLSILPLISGIYSYRNVIQATHRTGLQVLPSWGSFLLFWGVCFCAWAAIRLGQVSPAPGHANRN
ncbi:MAG: hypothetical protein AAF355_06445 [Myxococcota bacterium]